MTTLSMHLTWGRRSTDSEPFCCDKECDASDEYKQAYLDAKEDDVKIIKSPVGMPGRAIRNDFIKAC